MILQFFDKIGREGGLGSWRRSLSWLNDIFIAAGSVKWFGNAEGISIWESASFFHDYSPHFNLAITIDNSL